MTYLILSDIHSNLDALEAVLADAHGGYDSLLALGDLVGYGADPNLILEWARANSKAVVRGNHDKACAGGTLEKFNPVAGAAAKWTRNQLTPENRAYLKHLPHGPLHLGNCNGGFDLSHGSPWDEDQYLVSAWDLEGRRPASRLTFFGHTHVQGGFRIQRGGGVLELNPRRTLHLTRHQSYLVNPGSVGQPRDGDPRAAYALYDAAANIIKFHRVAYDIENAARKIRAAGLPERLAARLFEGC